VLDIGRQLSPRTDRRITEAVVPEVLVGRDERNDDPRATDVERRVQLLIRTRLTPRQANLGDPRPNRGASPRLRPKARARPAESPPRLEVFHTAALASRSQ
jgi:hypothetical protein